MLAYNAKSNSVLFMGGQGYEPTQRYFRATRGTSLVSYNHDRLPTLWSLAFPEMLDIPMLCVWCDEFESGTGQRYHYSTNPPPHTEFMNGSGVRESSGAGFTRISVRQSRHSSEGVSADQGTPSAQRRLDAKITIRHGPSKVIQLVYRDTSVAQLRTGIAGLQLDASGDPGSTVQFPKDWFDPAACTGSLPDFYGTERQLVVSMYPMSGSPCDGLDCGPRGRCN